MMPDLAMSKTMTKKQPGTVRIIGGKWRGTRLRVRDLPGLRPSGDRGRETLFNWLQMHLRGARCADLFAGSGVLGLEAASRGAARVTLLEKSRPAAAEIRESLARLKAEQVELIEGDAIAWLAQCEPLIPGYRVYRSALRGRPGNPRTGVAGRQEQCSRGGLCLPGDGP